MDGKTWVRTLTLLYAIIVEYASYGAGKIYYIPQYNYGPGTRHTDPNEFIAIKQEHVSYTGVAVALQRLKQAFATMEYTFELVSTGHNLSDATLIIDHDAYHKPHRRCPNWYKELLKYDPKKMVLLLAESHVVLPKNFSPKFKPNPGIHKHLYDYFNKVLVWDDTMVDGKNKLKIFYPQARLKMVEPLDFDKKKLCVMISGFRHMKHPHNGYNQRRKIASFFQRFFSQDLDLYGGGWPSSCTLCKGRVPVRRDLNFDNTLAQGQQDLINCMKKYKFCLCIENQIGAKGWITERIFDIFLSGCVPVYWGAANIAEYIPSNCFIDYRKFKNNFELHSFLASITREQYDVYLSNIKEYLASEEAFFFSVEHFMDIILSLVGKNYDKKLIFTQEQIDKLERMKKTALYKKFAKQ